MKRSFHFIFIKYILTISIAIFCMNSSVFGQNSWQKYSSPSNDFYISCPGGLMQYKTKNIESSLGVLVNEVHYLKMEGDHPNQLYMISIVTYPEEIIQSIEVGDSLLIESMNALATSTKSTIKYHELTRGSSGVTIVGRMEQDKGSSIKFKGKFTENKLYLLQVYTEHSNTINDFIDQFMNSFRIIE